MGIATPRQALRCHLSRQLGVPGMFSRWHRGKRERCHLRSNYLWPDAVAPSDCRRLSANLRNFSQSMDLQLVPARRSSRAAGDSSAAVWVAALGQNCIDVLICSLDFLLFFYILDWCSSSLRNYATYQFEQRVVFEPNTLLFLDCRSPLSQVCQIFIQPRIVACKSLRNPESGSFLQFLNLTKVKHYGTQ